MRHARMGGVAALALAVSVSPILATAVLAAPPSLTLTSPSAGPSTNASPTFAGTSDCTVGACSDITVNVYSGSLAVGLPVLALTAPKAATWSAGSASLPDGTYTVTASQSRQGGNGGLTVTAPVTFTIDTTGPLVTFSASNASSVVEGSTTTVRYSIADAGVGTVANVVVTCGAGWLSNASYTDTSGAFDCSFADGPLAASITAQATDSLGNEGSLVADAVDVLNEAPSVVLTSGATDLFDGDSSTYAYSISDPGADSVGSVSVSCGSGIASNAVNDDVSGTFDCTFPTVGATTVSLGATDSDGDAGPTASLDVNVAQSNRPPNVDVVMGDDNALAGDTKEYSVAASDPDGDGLSYAWSVSGGALFDGPSTSSEARIAFLAPGTVELSVDVSDANGHVVSRTTTIDVTVPPAPAPTPTPPSEPGPEPTAEPAPEPTPDPTIEPTPEPEPEPEPEPSQSSPAPVLPPGPQSSPPPQDSGSGGGSGPGAPSEEPQIGADATVPLAVGGADMEAISPNSDGRMDAVTVMVTFSERVAWSFELLDGDGLVMGTANVGRSLSTTWDGTVDGEPVPDGMYRWRVTGHDMAGNPIEPIADEIIVDRTAPRIMRVRFHRVEGGRHRRGVVAVTVGETADVQVQLVGRRRTFTLAVLRCPEHETVGASWNGSDALGRRIPRGSYRVVAVATDATWNQSAFQGRRIRIRR